MQGKHKLVYSPDTDVYHIGLTTADLQSNEVIVLLTPVGREMKLLHLNKLVDALESDLDLQCLPTEQIKEIIQVMYALSGCDFTSFFYGLNKNSFLKTLFENSALISTSCTTLPGSLADVKPGGNGFWAFLRLWGWRTSASMVRHLKTAGCLTHLFKDQWKRNTSSGTNAIRDAVWERIPFEDKLPPPLDALRLHWLRSIWVIDYLTGVRHVARQSGNGFWAFLRLWGWRTSASMVRHLKTAGCLTHLFKDQWKRNTSSGTNAIRDAVWERIPFEDKLPPPLDALRLHWLRSIWVIDYLTGVRHVARQSHHFHWHGLDRQL